MGVIAIVEPFSIAVAASGTGNGWTGTSRLLTPDPKEAAYYPAGGSDYISLDLGVERTIDTIFIGYTNDSGQGGMPFQAFDQGGNLTYENRIVASPGDGVTPFHFLAVMPAPVQARSLRIGFGGFPGGYTIGIAAVGLAFRPGDGGVQFGAGRPLEDTSTVERLFGGGFGIDEGTVTGGYQFTLVDLTQAERDKLYAMVRRLKTARSVLVIEDSTFSAGLNERIHWGLFRKLNTYERSDPQNWKWDFVVGDWA